MNDDVKLGDLMVMYEKYQQRLAYLRAYSRRRYADPEKRAEIRQKQKDSYHKKKDENKN